MVDQAAAALRGDAYKKVKPVEGIDEQGLVPDPQVMHVLFARLMACLLYTSDAADE